MSITYLQCILSVLLILMRDRFYEPLLIKYGLMSLTQKLHKQLLIVILQFDLLWKYSLRGFLMNGLEGTTLGEGFTNGIAS